METQDQKQDTQQPPQPEQQDPNPLYKHKDHFVDGAYVDAADTMSKWRVAEIIKVDHSDNTLYIHYEGWSKKWDEVRDWIFGQGIFYWVFLVAGIRSSEDKSF